MYSTFWLSTQPHCINPPIIHATYAKSDRGLKAPFVRTITIAYNIVSSFDNRVLLFTCTAFSNSDQPRPSLWEPDFDFGVCREHTWREGLVRRFRSASSVWIHSIVAECRIVGRTKVRTRTMPKNILVPDLRFCRRPLISRAHGYVTVERAGAVGRPGKS